MRPLPSSFFREADALVRILWLPGKIGPCESDCALRERERGEGGSERNKIEKQNQGMRMADNVSNLTGNA